MNNDKLVKVWPQKIPVDWEPILQRRLSDFETSFVRGREGFMALEMIQDSASRMHADDLLAYLIPPRRLAATSSPSWPSVCGQTRGKPLIEIWPPASMNLCHD